MYFAHLADVNVGIITTIWGVQPLGAALLDYLINNEKLTFHHLAGMIFILLGGLCVSMADKKYQSYQGVNYDYNPQVAVETQQIPKWIPVVFAVLAPCLFIA